MVDKSVWKSELERLASGYLNHGILVLAASSLAGAVLTWLCIDGVSAIITGLSLVTGFSFLAWAFARKKFTGLSHLEGYVLFAIVMIRDALIMSLSTAENAGLLSVIHSISFSAACMFFLWPVINTLIAFTFGCITYAAFFAISDNLTLQAYMSHGGFLQLVSSVFGCMLILVRYNMAKTMLLDKIHILSQNEWMATQQKIIEEKSTRLQQSNSRLKEFAYMVSHDLKAPLRGVRNIAAWIKEDFAQQLPQGVMTHLELMDKQIRRMEELIRDVLEYARTQAANQHQEWIRLDDLIHDVVEMIGADPNTKITIDSTVPEIRGTKIVISQVLQNLLTNSIKHNDKERKEVRILVSGDPQLVSFTVSDNGPGIDSGRQEEIFSLFHPVHDSGDGENTGIGLPVARKMVEEAGGKIWLESIPGKGAHFHFVLPRFG